MKIEKGDKIVVELPNWIVLFAIWGVLDVFKRFSKAIDTRVHIKSNKKEG